MSDDTALARAAHWLDVGRPDRCLDELQTSGDAPDVRFHGLQAMALVRLGRWQECVAATDRGLAQDPTDLELRYQRSLAVARLGDVAQAESLLLSCLADDPRNLALLCTYVHLLVSHGQLDQGEAVLARAAAVDPGSVMVEMARARVLLARRRDADAIEAVRRVLAQDPGRPEALEILGHLEQQRGRSRAAAGRLRAAALADLDDRDLARDAREADREARWYFWPLRFVRALPDAAVMPFQLGLVLVAVVLSGYGPTASVGAVLVVAVLVFVAWFWIAVLVTSTASRRNR